MTFGFAFATAGILLMYSGYSNNTVIDILRGLGVSRKPGAGDSFVSLVRGAGNAFAPGTGGTGPATGAGSGAPRGLTTFDGKPVCKWVARELQWARAHGWTGGLNSGYRSNADQARACAETTGACAEPGKSNHQGKKYPKCAADVTEAEELERILSKKPGRLLKYTGKSIGDDVHFSSGLMGV